MEAPESNSFTPTEINILLALIKQDTTDVAAAIDEDRTTVSKLLNRRRQSPRPLKKFAKHVAAEVEKRILAAA